MDEIVVLGSLNMDLVVQTGRVPAAGETLQADGFQLIPGGKGANQAVAASRQGGQVSFIGLAGSDPFGQTLRRTLEEERIDTRHLGTLAGVPNGVALILVEAGGENRILIVPGANGAVTTAQVDEAETLIRSAGLLVLQFEIPLPVVEYAVRQARSWGVPVLLNPAPAYPAGRSLLPFVDTLVLNETESEILTGAPVTGVAGALSAGRQLLGLGAGCAILTLGAGGAVVVTPEKAFHAPGFPVQVVDTTAAGDAFIGALAAGLTRRLPLEECACLANAAGALAVTRLGAQTSLPARQEVEELARSGGAGRIIVLD